MMQEKIGKRKRWKFNPNWILNRHKIIII